MRSANVLPVPGIVLGAYPERSARRTDELALVDLLRGLLPGEQRLRKYRRFAARVEALDIATPAIDPHELAARAMRVRAGLARERLADTVVAEAFLLVRRACERVMGVRLHTEQLMAARIMLDGQLAEMATGEGKTLAAGACAATAALAGIPIHVITSNDYLVARDAEILRPIYAALGLTVAAVTQATPQEARRAAYDADIVYCTAPELVFDYLRDGMLRERRRDPLRERVESLGAPHGGRRTLLRGLCMAIVDEADSILIDEARVPLVLSERASNADERRYLDDALRAASSLAAEDYRLRPETLSAELTDAGRAALDAQEPGRHWRNRLHRDENVCTALAALHLFERDRHYLVRDGAITIIDECTGRAAVGRIWSRGLHRLIELKEGCEASTDVVTLAQITYQRFFQRYLSLGGMSGTLREARGELQSVYGLEVVKVPLHKPDRRKVLPTRLFTNRDALWDATVTEALKASGRGQPVLIGTDSVAESEALAARLAQAGVAHAVLNARQDAQEAETVAQAGQAGRITVATNMAGRGTDIALGAGVAERGGLHVISCQHNASRRIDRQLVGRAARRGDPGSAQTLLALDKPLIARCLPGALARVVQPDGLDRPQWLVQLIVRVPQHLEERRQRRQRRALLIQDLRAAEQSSFARPLE